MIFALGSFKEVRTQLQDTNGYARIVKRFLLLGESRNHCYEQGPTGGTSLDLKGVAPMTSIQKLGYINLTFQNLNFILPIAVKNVARI